MVHALDRHRADYPTRTALMNTMVPYVSLLLRGFTYVPSGFTWKKNMRWMLPSVKPKWQFILKMWSPERQHQHHLILSPYPDLLNQKLWGLSNLGFSQPSRRL